MSEQSHLGPLVLLVLQQCWFQRTLWDSHGPPLPWVLELWRVCRHMKTQYASLDDWFKRERWDPIVYDGQQE